MKTICSRRRQSQVRFPSSTRPPNHPVLMWRFRRCCVVAREWYGVNLKNRQAVTIKLKNKQSTTWRDEKQNCSRRTQGTDGGAYQHTVVTLCAVLILKISPLWTSLGSYIRWVAVVSLQKVDLPWIDQYQHFQNQHHAFHPASNWLPVVVQIQQEKTRSFSLGHINFKIILVQAVVTWRQIMNS